MKSLDANILVYAHNTGCPEHGAALAVLTDLLSQPAEWVLADQTLFEFYRCIRNPVILTQPLSAPAAAARLDLLRDQTGCRRCQYRNGDWPSVRTWLAAADFPYRRSFDAVPAFTLRAAGVDTFYTRNVKDFAGYGFARVIDPITGEHT